jgi:RNA polymerase sigma-70 factor (ECF subfamily)
VTTISATGPLLALDGSAAAAGPETTARWEPDAQLRSRAAAGDDQAQRIIFNRYVDRVHRLAYRIAGESHLAEDITQETFIRAFTRLSQFREAARFSTWLHSIAVSVALNVVRKQRKWWARETALDTASAVVASDQQIEPDLRDRVRSAVAALPEDQRVILVMHDVEGYTHDEIAECLSISAGACRMRLSRARGALRERLHLDGEEWNR